MLGVRIYAAGDLRVEEMPSLSGLVDGEVRIAVSKGGICGSDLHYYRHGGFGTVRLKEPMYLGHEVAGVVLEIGGAVAGLAVGSKVAVNPSRPCNQCRYCLAGKRNLCEDMRFNGSAMRFPHEQGLFRAELIFPTEQLVPLSAKTDLRLAACAEPFAVSLHAVARAGDLVGKRVLISGAGPIGCFTLAAAKRAGAAEIIVTDLSDAPLVIATRLGATSTINLRQGEAEFASLSAGKGAIDVAFECSGAASALSALCDVVRPAGTVVTIGMGGAAPLPLGAAVTKELNVVGSFRFDEEFALAAQLIDRGEVDLSPIITSVMPVSKAVDAFELSTDRERAMKVQLDFETG